MNTRAGERERTSEEVAELLGMTPKRVRRIEKYALEKLRARRKLGCLLEFRDAVRDKRSCIDARPGNSAVNDIDAGTE